MAQPILFHMAPADLHLHVIVNDYNGHLYVIDSMDGCVERMDIGGQSYPTVYIICLFLTVLLCHQWCLMILTITVEWT